MNSIEKLEAPNGKCKICEPGVDPIWGIKGEGSTDILFVLQSSDYRALEHSQGYTGALLESLTGKDIDNIILHDWRNIALVNSVKCHFKENNQWRDPKREEYRNCKENLVRQIDQTNPSLVVCCGSWAIKAVFGEKNYDRFHPDRYSIRFQERGDTVFAITTHPRQFTCPVKAELTDMVTKFRREHDIESKPSLEFQSLTNHSI
jgi:uracil-DNA glycosylase family 4